MTRVWTRVLTADDLGRFVSDLRVDRDLTQQELADTLGVRRQYVNEIEAGKSTLQVDRLLALLRTLGARVIVDAEVDEQDTSL